MRQDADREHHPEGFTKNPLCYNTQMSGAETPENKKSPMAVSATGRVSFWRRGISRPHFDRFSLAEFTSADFHLMDLSQYNVFGQAHGVCGWYSR